MDFANIFQIRVHIIYIYIYCMCVSNFAYIYIFLSYTHIHIYIHLLILYKTYIYIRTKQKTLVELGYVTYSLCQPDLLNSNHMVSSWEIGRCVILLMRYYPPPLDSMLSLLISVLQGTGGLHVFRGIEHLKCFFHVKNRWCHIHGY